MQKSLEKKSFDKVHKEIPYCCDIITDKIVNHLKNSKDLSNNYCKKEIP